MRANCSNAYRQDSRVMFPVFNNSSIRPGVPTTMSTPADNWSIWSLALTPPTSNACLIWPDKWRLKEVMQSCVCWANSLLGSTISALGPLPIDFGLDEDIAIEFDEIWLLFAFSTQIVFGGQLSPNFCYNQK